MKRMINKDDIYSWLRVMSDPCGYNNVNMYWRFSGALDVLEHLELITHHEKSAWLDYYLSKYIAETGA